MQQFMINDVFFDVFISYSTRDPQIANTLRRALEIQGRNVWQDVDDMELTAEWWGQIKHAIDHAYNFAFIMSPNSLSSPICHLELEYAKQQGKRLILIRYQEADQAQTTQAMLDRLANESYIRLLTDGRDMQAVADQNWITLQAIQQLTIPTVASVEAKMPALIEAFDQDLEYIRQGNVLLSRANEWHVANEESKVSFLLLGDALYAAEAWLDAGKTPPPTELHRNYIIESRAEENYRKQVLRRTRLAGLSLVGLVVAALVVLAFTGSQLLAAQTAQQEAEDGLAAAEIAQSNAERAAEAAQTEQATAESQREMVVATVTQASVMQDISQTFSDALLQYPDDLDAQLSIMDDVVATYPDEAMAYMIRAIVYDNREEYDIAIDDYNTAIELAPDNSLLYYNRGDTYRLMENWDSALDNFSTAIALDPDYIDAYQQRAFTYLEIGEFENAIDDLNTYIQLFPDDPEIYYLLGLLYYVAEDYEAALVNFDQAIALGFEIPDEDLEIYEDVQAAVED